jgi:hypothetical protein
LKGRAVKDAEEMKVAGEKVYLEGNARLLTKYLQEVTGFADL